MLICKRYCERAIRVQEKNHTYVEAKNIVHFEIKYCSSLSIAQRSRKV